MDDILNIDECLSDSFSLSSDTDLRNIVDQWKSSCLPEENKDSKIFDTRTFTRPKKRLFSGSDVNNTYAKPGTSLSQDNDGSAVNLQIGGLVTSMQRSYLGDVSPPVSVLMADTSLGNSLITSSDFTNIGDFISDEDTLNSAQFNRYTLKDVARDRNFLEKLTAYDDSLFTKDADIEKIDVNQLLGNLSGNSTLQSSMSSSSHTTKADETFTPDGNVTFNATITEVDRTYLQIGDEQKNGTFEVGDKHAANCTFNAEKARKPCMPFDKTVDMLDDESMVLSDTFGVVDNRVDNRTFNGNMTINISKNGHLFESPLSSPLMKTAPMNDMLASTPSRQLPERTDNAKIKSIQKIDIDSISPIANDAFKFDDSLRGNGTFSTPTTGLIQMRKNRINEPLNILNLRDEERRSLTNFEDFENTLSLIENQDDVELDDLLNSIGTVPHLKNEKIRQSLDNIKKRHSLINLEKQQQDEQKRLEASINRSGVVDTTTVIDRQRMNDSINKLMMSSSGSGERLLRRSRLYDDAVMNSSGEARAMHKSAVMNETMTQLTEANNRTLNVVDDVSDNQVANSNNTYSQNETHKTEDATGEHNEPEVDRNNRDRFKTIRIFKRPPENAPMVPDYEDTQTMVNQSSANQHETIQSNDHFTAKNTNSPKVIADAVAEANETRRSSSASGIKRSALVRPKYLSGIAKRDTSALRASSQEILSSGDGPSQPKPVVTLKSPMGIKAKSIHNLASSTNPSRYSIAHGIQRESRPATRDFSLTRTTTTSSGNIALNKTTTGNAFKVPLAKPALRAGSTVKKLTLVRPSSGYYSMNTKRTDSDTESGRFSSNNSLSSGSSRGSLYTKPDTHDSEVTQQLSPPEPMPVTSSLSTPKSINGIAKPSGLRPPSSIKRSGLPRPSGIPKR